MPRQPSRERMIAAAETLMREQGLAGAAINPVVKLSRAPIGSVYHHFPGGKTQLASEALRIHGEKVRRLLVAAFDTKKPLPQRLRTSFRHAATVFEDAGARKGCAIGAVTLVWRILDGPMKGGSGEEKKYAASRVSEDVYAISYLAASGHTLTVVMNMNDKRMFGFASNDKEWFALHGTVDGVQ